MENRIKLAEEGCGSKMKNCLLGCIYGMCKCCTPGAIKIYPEIGNEIENYHYFLGKLYKLLIVYF